MILPPDPTASPTNSPSVALAEGDPINTIFDKTSTISAFGCATISRAYRAIDKNTLQTSCYRDIDPNTGTWPLSGFIITPTHGRMSIATGFRFYPSKCRSCDPNTYILEGRTSAQDPWIEIAAGGIAQASRNDPRLSIVSTFESCDPNRNCISIDYPSNSASYLEYRVTFPSTVASGWLRFAEIELPGILL